MLADAPTLQAFTGDSPQLCQEVFLLPLGNTVLRDAEVGLGRKAGEKGSGLGCQQHLAELVGKFVSFTPLLTVANMGTEQQIAHLGSPRGGDRDIYVALSTAPLNAWSPSYSELWSRPLAHPLTCSFSKTFFFGLSSSSGSPPS